jgi:hypothetical protein
MPPVPWYTYSTTIYGSPTDPRVAAIINLAPKTSVIYKCAIYILHPELSYSTIRRDFTLSISYAPCSVIYMLHTTLPWYTFCTKHLRHIQFDPGYRARLSGNPRSEKWLGIEWLAVGRSHDIKAQAQMWTGPSANAPIGTFSEKQLSNEKDSREEKQSDELQNRVTRAPEET